MFETYFVEFSGGNQLAGENSKGEVPSSDLLLVPDLARLVASSAEFYG